MHIRLPADPVPLKSSDSRSRRFIKQHGPTAYELDAFHPEQLLQLMYDSIVAFTDMSEYESNAKKEEIDMEAINNLKNEVRDYIETLGIWAKDLTKK